MQTRFGSPHDSYDMKAHVEFTGIIAICNPKHFAQTTIPAKAHKSQATRRRGDEIFYCASQYFWALRMELASCNPSGTWDFQPASAFFLICTPLPTSINFI
jgi:hypothetical protein